MGTNTLGNPVAAGEERRPSDINQYRDALDGEFVGRQDGVPTAGQSLGNPQYPWGDINAQGLSIDGNRVDFRGLTQLKYGIISGPVGEFGNPQFIVTEGVSSGFRIPGALTPLRLIINGKNIVIGSNVDFNLNNTLLVTDYINDRPFAMNFKDAESLGSLNYDDSHDYFEEGHIGMNAGMPDIFFRHISSNIVYNDFPLENVSIAESVDARYRLYTSQRTAILDSGETALRGRAELVCLSFGNPSRISGNTQDKDSDSREFIVGRFKKVGEKDYQFSNVRRKYLLKEGKELGQSFNIFRMRKLSSNRLIWNDIFTSGKNTGFTYHQLVWVIVDANNPTNIILSKNEPYYHRDLDGWTIDKGKTASKDILPIGIVCSPYFADSANRSRFAKSFEFSKNYKRTNTINIVRNTLDTGRLDSERDANIVSVYGNQLNLGRLRFSYQDNGRSNGDGIYFYITPEGNTRGIIGQAPLYKEELQGYYHPINPWRCVGHHIWGNVEEGISTRYSSVKRYEKSLSFFIETDGTATLSKSDVTVSREYLDGEFARNFFRFIRPWQGPFGSPSYSWIRIIMDKNNLFRRFEKLLESSDIKFTPVGRTSHASIVTAIIRNHDGQDAFTAGSYPQGASASIVITINRTGADLIEKRRWNELSS